MSVKAQFHAEDVGVSRREYDDHVEFVADFGPAADASVDVVGDTVIVVADDDHHEFEVEGDAQAVMKNGVVTIEVRQ